jgi:hypothetical protein
MGTNRHYETPSAGRGGRWDMTSLTQQWPRVMQKMRVFARGMGAKRVITVLPKRDK